MELNPNAQKLLSKQVEVMLNATGKSGSSGRWPMPVLKTTMDASIHSEQYLAQTFFNRVRKLKEKGYTYESIAKLFKYPSTLARLTFVPRTRAIWRMSKEEQVEMYNGLAEILAHVPAEMPFCENGENILLLNEEVRQIVLQLDSAEQVSSALTTQLDGRLWMYSEMAFGRWHNLAHEFHGPYQVENEKLLVKEWHDLKGPGWEVFASFPYDNITCYEFFSENEITLDIHNRLSTSKPFAESLHRAHVQIDGRPVGIAQINELIGTLDEYLYSGSLFLSSQKASDLKRMNAVMEFYTIKPLADELGEDWHPPQEVYDSIARSENSEEYEPLLRTLREFFSQTTRENIEIQYDPSKPFPELA